MSRHSGSAPGRPPAPSDAIIPEPGEPTSYPAGAPEKIEVLRARAARGEPLFHADDCPVIGAESKARGTVSDLPRGISRCRVRGRGGREPRCSDAPIWRYQVRPTAQDGSRPFLGYYDTPEEAEARLRAWLAEGG